MKKKLGIAGCALLLIGALMHPDLLPTADAPPQVISQHVVAERQADVTEPDQMAGERDEPAAELASTGRRSAAAAPATRPDWRLTGSVSTADGSAAGARVHVCIVSPYHHQPLTDIACAGDGSYTVDLSALARLPQLDRARTKVAVSACAVGHTEWDAVLDLPHHDPRRSLELRQTFHLEATAVARGRIVDPAGRPVAGARVRLLTPSGRELHSVASDPDGRYRLADAAASAVLVDAVHDRLGTGSTTGELRFGADTELPDLRLFSSSILSGRIVFEDRQPVPGVRIRVGNRSAETDEHGRFSVSSLPLGEHALVLGEERVRTPRTVTTGAAGQEIVLTGKHLVRLRFEDQAGRELRPFAASYRVYGSEHDASLRDVASGGMLPDRLEDDGSGTGRVEQLLLATGSWLWVQARHDDAVGDTLLRMDRSRNIVDATIRLAERAPDARLRVIATSSDGRPVGPIQARLEQVQLGDLAVESLQAIERDASDDRSHLPDGEHTLYRAAAGVYRLCIDAPRRSRLDQQDVFAPIAQTVRLHPGEETVVPVEVRPVGHVRFRFHAQGLEAGTDIPGLTIDTACADGHPQGWRGHFISKRTGGWVTGPAVAAEWIGWRMPVPAGRHLLTVKAAGYEEQQLSVIVLPREVVEVDVGLQPKR